MKDEKSSPRLLVEACLGKMGSGEMLTMEQTISFLRSIDWLKENGAYNNEKAWAYNISGNVHAGHYIGKLYSN